MKRLIIVASLAILAVGCQKTFVQNEVQTPIGFSTEVGKQTRAIVDNYSDYQPFGVFAYGYDNGVANDDPVMGNVEIAKGNSGWKATDGITYYWPNDPDNYLNFYAYSPVLSEKSNANLALAAHQVLVADNFAHSEGTGLSFTGYDHAENMYVDFMVADPVDQAKYTDQNGDGNNDNDPATSTVPATFHHEFTQINFVVKIKDDASYPNVDFNFQSISFNNVITKANYTNANLVPNGTYAAGTWTNPTKTTFDIFPVKKYAANALNGAPGIDADETPIVLHTDDREDNPQTAEVEASSPAKVSFSTTPITMIPQTLISTVADNPETNGEDESVAGQSFTINYTISGKGVATETISKTFDFLAAANSPQWIANKKITYTLTIGLNEITFTPSVAAWSDTYDDDDDDDTPEVSTNTDVNIS